jgi:hypothetical protein
MKKELRKHRNHILSMRVSAAERGMIRTCALERNVRVSEIMREALRVYMLRHGEHTNGKEL